MKKKLIALFAACSMMTIAAAGMVQTAYADTDPVRIVVSDGATDTEKVLTFYYESDNLQGFEGYLSVDNGATIDSAAITATYPSGLGDKNAAKYQNTDQWQIMVSCYADEPMTTADKSFATATITVPGDVDVTATLTIGQDAMFYNVGGEWLFFDPATITVTIPKKESAPSKTDAEVTKVEKQNEKQDNEEINGTGKYENQKAVIYGVEITPNDDTVTGATVALDGKSGEVDFGGEFTGSGTVVFAVILASESGAALPTLEEDNVTPIVKATIE